VRLPLLLLLALPALARAEARLFGEGVISTPFDEFGATITPDGKTLFFTRSVPRSNVYVICRSEWRNGGWDEPEVSSFSGQYWDFDPVLSPDGARMVFASDRPPPGGKKADQDFDLWVVDRTGAGWSAPRHLGPTVNSDGDETFASIAGNGTLYFVSDRGTGREHLAIYRAPPEGAGYGLAEKLAGPINDPENFTLEALVAPDESYLLLTPMGRQDGLGSFDIYVSRRQGDTWSEPKDLGPKVNTRARDYSPRFAPDGKTLLFASERGFATEPLARPMTYPELRRNLAATLNGWGNIYAIDLAEVGLELGK
jgi:Tol biopolymer transport system component